MSELPKNFATPAPKSAKAKRPSTVSAASSSRMRTPSSTGTKKIPPAKPKINKNAIIIDDADVTLMKQEAPIPNFDAENRQIAYGKFLREMLEECFIDEKIDREETEMDHQMLQLAERFQKTMHVLDKTNRRLKDVSFVVEQKRLLNLKSQDSNKCYEMTDSSNAHNLLQNLATSEQACLDKLETRNIDFGYDKDSGHQQLLDAVNDAITGLEDIKKHSSLDMTKFKEYEKSQMTLQDLDKDKMDLETLKADFEEKFPKFSEKLLMEISEKIAGAFDNVED